jgi:hypothetical protein
VTLICIDIEESRTWISSTVFYISSGIANSHIFYDLTLLTWVLQSLRKPDKKITMWTKRPGELPLGRHIWLVDSDFAFCGKTKDSKVELTLSTCFPDKYTCDDGHCIDLRYTYISTGVTK